MPIRARALSAILPQNVPGWSPEVVAEPRLSPWGYVNVIRQCGDNLRRDSKSATRIKCRMLAGGYESELSKCRNEQDERDAISLKMPSLKAARWGYGVPGLEGIMLSLSTGTFRTQPIPNVQVGESSRSAKQQKPFSQLSLSSSSLETVTGNGRDHGLPSSQQPGPSKGSHQENWPLRESAEAFLSEIKNTDWRRFEPPPELTFRQTDIEVEVRPIFQISVDRIKARYREGKRAAASPPTTTPNAVEEASVSNPHGQVSMSDAVEQPDRYLNPNGPRYRGGSSSSGTSQDSGYGSMSSPLSSENESSKMFKISSFFKRKGKEVIRDTLNKSSPDFTTPPARQAPPTPNLEQEASTPPSLERECVSCLDDFDHRDMIKLVCHNYCKLCFSRLIATAMDSETHWPAKCCLNTIPSDIILPQLDSKSRKKYEKREEEWSIPVGDRIYCSAPSCSTFIPPKQIRAALHSVKCPTCSKDTCTICRGPYHDGSDCPRDPAVVATQNLAELEGWRRCYNCNSFVEHNQGCRHMTCRCKAQFCYICGLKWRTCSCTEAQLVTRLAQVNTRRLERQVEEQRRLQEEEEVRRAVQEIEEMERREAERLAREAEAERRAAETLRRRREENRIAAISRKYRNYTNQLAALHDTQRIFIAERHEHEVEILQKEMEDTKATLQLRQSTELQLLGVESQTALSDMVYLFDKEYKEKRAEERRIEEEYLNQLRQYWDGNPEGDLKVYKAINELRRDLDRQFKEWDLVRQRQLDMLATREARKVKDIRARQANELIELQERNKVSEHDWRVKRWAEQMWMDGVARERWNMLLTMEQAAYALGTS
ncbi:hypothetical protein B7463_g7132, partial [Scytalidium lignicola]